MAGTKKSHVITRHVAPWVPVALAVGSLAAPFKPTPAPNPAGAIVAAKCEEVADLHACHSSYPTGCSPSGGYDAYLNYLKNYLFLRLREQPRPRFSPRMISTTSITSSRRNSADTQIITRNLRICWRKTAKEKYSA